jgi:hypothetical protein
MRRLQIVLTGFAAFAALAWTQPAAAQCVYVACQSGVQGPVAPGYGVAQDSMSSTSSTSQITQDRYEEGYAAGHRAGAASAPVRHTTKAKASHRVSHARPHGKPKAKRKTAHVAAKSRSAHTASKATTRHASRRTSTRVAHFSPSHSYVRDLAQTYGTSSVGPGVNLGSVVSARTQTVTHSSMRTSFVGPTTTIVQGGQVCGWGSQIVYTPHGPQRQSAWLCQCPQGWRPPGY